MLGHAPGLQLPAEGAERSDQLDFLRKEGCDARQGHLFAQPMPENALLALLTPFTQTTLAAYP